MSISIDEEMRRRVDNALNEGKTLTAAYVDARDQPHISFYGSTHVHSDDQLAVWARNPEGALVSVIAEKQHMALIYGDIADRVYYTFEGRGRVVTDEAERNRVYEEMHPIERQFDPECGGVAIVIDLDRVVTLSKAGKSEMLR